MLTLVLVDLSDVTGRIVCGPRMRIYSNKTRSVGTGF
jgi:hypothetical protein